MNYMRIAFSFIIWISSIPLLAQTALQPGAQDSIQRGIGGINIHSISSAWDKKWSLTTYGGISTGFGFFNSAITTYVSVPLGLQLNRRLNNNLYGFTGIFAGPAYASFNRSFISSDVNKLNQSNGFYRTNNLGIYGRAELGLMYVNDARTFSISGSIGVQRSSNPIFNYQPMSTARQNLLLISPNR